MAQKKEDGKEMMGDDGTGGREPGWGRKSETQREFTYARRIIVPKILK